MLYRWLVENFTPQGQSTGLYMACQVHMTLTADVNAARKFRMQRTAEFRALDMREQAARIAPVSPWSVRSG